jgi:hypothetical protein
VHFWEKWRSRRPEVPYLTQSVSRSVEMLLVNVEKVFKKVMKVRYDGESQKQDPSGKVLINERLSKCRCGEGAVSGRPG